MKTSFRIILLSSMILISIIIGISLFSYFSRPKIFSGERAYQDVKYQVDLGPRTIGSEAHSETEKWIASILQKNKWVVEIQEGQMSGLPVKNIIGSRGTGTPWIIIGSHYDTRPLADNDKTIQGRKGPVLGANDGASSVSILLELARILPRNIDKQIWLVFFDAEDNGELSGYDWSLGSQYFVSVMSGEPNYVIILDMVGDKDLNIYMEKNSNPELNAEIWGVASELGYTQFIPAYKHELIDDHLPFVQDGIRAIDIIDFNYPYWHTSQDTIDKISANSLQVVGDTILQWLKKDHE